MIENAHATAGLKECRKHRLQVLKKDLGCDGAPMLEQLLIQQTALCWLKLNLVELSYSSTLKQSHTLTQILGSNNAFSDENLAALREQLYSFAELALDIRDRSSELHVESALEAALTFAVSALSNAAAFWNQCSPEQKPRFQRVLFPDGLVLMARVSEPLQLV